MGGNQFIPVRRKVLFAIFCGGQLFGFLGVLLALPVAAIIMVLLRHLREQYMKSRWYEI